MELAFIFLLLSLSSKTFVGAADPVLDTSGHQLRTDADYYVLPILRGQGGGLTLGSDNGSCPLDVVQAPEEVSRGLPLRFTPARGGATVLSGADHNVVFSAASVCVQSTVWRVGQRSGSGERVVTTGGAAGNPGRGTLGNWFQINGEGGGGDGYRLAFCPGVCNICRPQCGVLEVHSEGGRRRVVVRSGGGTGAGFRVKFQKATTQAKETVR